MESCSSTSTLLTDLVILLRHLAIPVTLLSPLDLTPSLLLAVLESILHQRLPLSPVHRQAQSKREKVQAIKVFLGVLGDNLLGSELGDVDPRRLAEGEEEEIYLVGGLLCLLARQKGIFDQSSSQGEYITSQLSPPSSRYSDETFRLPSPPISVLGLRGTGEKAISEMQARKMHHDNSPDCIHQVSLPTIIGTVPPSTSTPRVSTPLSMSVPEMGQSSSCQYCQCSISYDTSFDASATYCNCTPSLQSGMSLSAPPANVVRRDGWIQRVDGDVEAFEAFRAASRTKESTRRPHFNVTSHKIPTQHTLSLLNERARILEELAALKARQNLV